MWGWVVGGVAALALLLGWLGWRRGEALRTLDQDDHEDPPPSLDER